MLVMPGSVVAGLSTRRDVARSRVQAAGASTHMVRPSLNAKKFVAGTAVAPVRVTNSRSRQGGLGRREIPEARSGGNHDAAGRPTGRGKRRDGHGRLRRGLEAEHHQGHRNPDSGYASADMAFHQTHSIVLSFRIDIPPNSSFSLDRDPLSVLPPSSLNPLPWAHGITPSRGGEVARPYTPAPHESNFPGDHFPEPPLIHAQNPLASHSGVHHSYRERLPSAKVASRWVGRCAYTKNATHPPPWAGSIGIFTRSAGCSP